MTNEYYGTNIGKKKDRVKSRIRDEHLEHLNSFRLLGGGDGRPWLGGRPVGYGIGGMNVKDGVTTSHLVGFVTFSRYVIT